MISAAPTIVAIETNSAWVVILAVSLVTLPAALILRRLIDRPGALASSLLLGLPLALPLIAAFAFQRSVLPEVSVLRPLGPDLFKEPDWNLFHLLFVTDGDTSALVPYVFSGSPGRWLFLLGAAFSSFMLLRRLAGAISMRRLIARCHRVDPVVDRDLLLRFENLARATGTKRVPRLLFLPEDVRGAFVVGLGGRPRVLLSAELADELSDEELDAILAHELAHVAAKDVPVLVVAGLLRDVVGWNPIAHFALRRLTAEREFEADRCAAAVTGKPLVVASSLIKMCEHMRYSARVAHQSVAFVRRRGRLKRRVAHLLALADRSSSVPSARQVPYVAAACLAAVLGLQAGARIAQQADFAIVWNAPETGTFPVWSRDWKGASQPDRKVSSERGKAKKRTRVKAGALSASSVSAFDEGYALREQDFQRWMRSLVAGAKRPGLSARTLKAEVTTSWRAVPLFKAHAVGPVGLYRIDLFSERQLPGPQR